MSGAILQHRDVSGRRVVRDAADVVVIGTGAAGATAARVLTEAGLDVVLLEEGAHVRTEDFTLDALSSFRRLWRDMGFQVARGRSMIPILQGMAVGGTTVINGAIIHRLPEPVHAGWMREGAVDGLLAYRELDRVFDQMDRELSVATAPEEVLGENNRLMRAGVEGIGLPGNVVRRNVAGCDASSRCNQGCPGGRKQGMNLTYVPRAVAAGARVYATCRAERLVVRRGRASGVEGRFRDPVDGHRGPSLRVDARHAVVVAASAIQTPLFLLDNGVRGGGRVGRGLVGHPGTSVMAVFDSPVDMWHGATQGWESTHLKGEGIKLESVAVPREIAVARLPGHGAQLRERVDRLEHVTQWGIECRAVTKGRVRRGVTGGAAITYDMQPVDVRMYRKGVRLLCEAAFDAGAREVYPGVHGMPQQLTRPDEARVADTLPDDPRRFHFIMAHLFSTAVMHPDPRRGAVDAEGRSHDVPGLVVVDSSVFPSNLGVNPQHSICAVSWLLAERLAERRVRR